MEAANSSGALICDTVLSTEIAQYWTAIEAAIVLFLLMALAIARHQSQSLKKAVDDGHDFERRGAAPSHFATAFWGPIRQWWAESASVPGAITGILFFGYIIPSMLLVAAIFGAIVVKPNSYFPNNAKSADCISLFEDVVGYVLFRETDAAAFGALTTFKIAEPKATFSPANTESQTISFVFAVSAAVGGSLSLVRILARWLGNLAARLRFKLNRLGQNLQGAGFRAT